jgi:diguanylate cyclase (GGDEF)-like protein
MLLDQTSLLLALGLAGVAVGGTLFIAWLSSRSESFLLTWSMGMAMLVAGVAAFAVYGDTAHYLLGVVAYSLLTIGFVIVHAAAHQFRHRKLPLARASAVGLAGLVIVCAPFALGYDGLGTAMFNFVAATILVATAWQYWLARDEAPAPIIGIVVLYDLTALSFIICGIAILQNNPLLLPAPPDSWAEDLNVIMCLVGITGIGALSISLNQTRLARRHQADARTDTLTGLVNRRELFKAYDSGPVPLNTAVIMFDLDRFKAINDVYGHATGDAVLRRFAAAIGENLRPLDIGARLDGEEFAVVMPRCTPDLAVLVAERIRALFESDVIATDRGPLRCTVSTGVAIAAAEGESFDSLLQRADAALDLAKNGRNRVIAPGLRLVT